MASEHHVIRDHVKHKDGHSEHHAPKHAALDSSEYQGRHSYTHVAHNESGAGERHAAGAAGSEKHKVAAANAGGESSDATRGGKAVVSEAGKVAGDAAPKAASDRGTSGKGERKVVSENDHSDERSTAGGEHKAVSQKVAAESGEHKVVSQKGSAESGEHKVATQKGAAESGDTKAVSQKGAAESGDNKVVSQKVAADEGTAGRSERKIVSQVAGANDVPARAAESPRANDSATRGILDAHAIAAASALDSKIQPGTTVGGTEAQRQAFAKGYIEVPPAPYPVPRDGAGTAANQGDARGVTPSDTTVVVTPSSQAAKPGDKPAVEVRFNDKGAPVDGAQAGANAADAKLADGKPVDANGQHGPVTFRVNADGKIVDGQGQEVSKDIAFANGVPKNVLIQVDRPANFDQMTPQQQQEHLANQQATLNAFVQNSLDPALKSAGAAAADGVEVKDKTKLLQPESVTQLAENKPETQVGATPKAPNEVAPMSGSGTVADGAGRPADGSARAANGGSAERPLAKSPEPVVAPQEHYSAPERHASHRMNGRRGMQNDHHGSMPRRMADSFFPEGTPALPGEKADNVARREMLAAAHNPDRTEPYGTIRQQPDGHSYSVGRYGHSYNHFNGLMHRALGNAMKGWPQSVLDELGHPPDWSKLSEILKKHPELMQGIQQSVAEQMKNGEVPKELGDKLSNEDSLGKFGSFVSKLRGDGTPPTKEDLAQNFGKDLQDAMARDTVDRGIRAGRTAGETALAQHLGIEPDQLTDQQRNDPQNKAFTQSADKLYALGLARQQDGPTHSKNPNDRIDWYAGKNGESQANVSDISPELGKKMANWAKNWAARNPETHDANGIGNCTRLARMLYKEMGVMNLPGMSGVEQGKALMRSGLFRQVDKEEARAGDFAFRGWQYRRSPRTGANLGDSLIVTGNDGRNVYGVNGASNREFAVTRRGGYYTQEIYLRPTAKFYEMMQRNKNA